MNDMVSSNINSKDLLLKMVEYWSLETENDNKNRISSHNTSHNTRREKQIH